VVFDFLDIVGAYQIQRSSWNDELREMVFYNDSLSYKIEKV
jgi:hypothetical protein